MTTELKLKALDAATCTDGVNATNVAQVAASIYAFLTASDAPDEASSASSDSTTTPSPRKRRASAAASSTQAASAPTEAASSTSTAESTPAQPSAQAAQAAAASPASGTSPASSLPSKDDVRGALTRYQAACGGDMAPPREILTKYAPTGTLGSLKEEDYAKVIKACDEAAAAKAKK